jgi:lysozyme
VKAPSPKVLAGAMAAVTACVAFYKPWEGGDVLTPYRDVIGVWTACAGVTRIEHRTYTRAECEALDREQAVQHLTELARCIHEPLTEHQWVALGSWVYNIGSANACRSGLVRKINAGASPSDWCRELLKWDYAGGKRLRGLTRRRQAEYAECLRS